MLYCLLKILRGTMPPTWYIPEQVDACSTDVYFRGFLSAPVIVRGEFATGGMGSQHHYVLPTDMSPEAL